MSAFSETSIDELKPRDRRYDVPVDAEFMLSVLPNGIKTWVYVYEDKGRLRRRTLGVHPDMSQQQAREALAAAQTFTDKFTGEMAPRPTSRATTAPVPPALSRRWWGVSLTGAGIVVAVLVLVWRSNGDAPAPLTARDETPVAAAEAASDEITAPVHDSTEIDQPATPAWRPEPVTTPAAPEPALLPAVSSAGPDLEEIQIAATAIALDDPAPDAAAAIAAPAPVEAASSPPARRSSGTLARAQLTSAVVDREPRDTLPPVVTGSDGEISTVFYFTEVRGFAGRSITHVWTLDGEVVAEVPIEVGQSWRWRAYSQKDLLSTMAGLWTVTVLDDAGIAMSEARFEYQIEASGSEVVTAPPGSR